MKLIIGNKNYSSWSFRPWIALTVGGVAFDEELIPFNTEGRNPDYAAFSPTSQVPVLIDGDVTIWQSLAIIDHVARKHPQAGLWPDDANARSRAMAMSCEMLASFFALRGACPMNMRRPRAAIEVTDAIRADIDRIEVMWADALAASGGPFLFGDRFTAADAMYAPVVNRLDVYAHTVTQTSETYMNTIKALPAWQAWEAAGRAEPWIVEADEA
ncbi:MAG: glutathione S-transferase family protein [Devosiaceae bacterium]|nr:glutathione S-transferase family protein [Devosiaceae bacterium MH13]